jgi:hypothetical protein
MSDQVVEPPLKDKGIEWNWSQIDHGRTHMVLFARASCQGGFVPPECLDLRNLASHPSHPAWGGSRDEPRYRLEEEEGKEPKLLRLVWCSGSTSNRPLVSLALESPRIHQAVNAMSRGLDRCGIGSLKEFVLSHVELSKIDQTNTYITYKYHHSIYHSTIFYYSVVVPVNSIGGVIVGSFGSFGSFQTNWY